MINIVCFKWGSKFTPEYVNKLHNMINRHVTIPHNFICYTEDPKGIECETRPFIKELPTWWYIVGLFNKEHGFKDKTVYLDLDTVILDNIDHILSWDVDFAILRDFYRPRGLQTAFITWEPEWGAFIWDKFLQDKPNLKASSGTNGFIEKCVPPNTANKYQDEFPDELVSYKVHIRDKKLNNPPEKAKMVFYHGNPRPCELRNLGWMKENWI